MFATFLLTGFREQEVMFLRWSDINFELRTVRVTSKPELGFYPKRWEDREIPAPVELIDLVTIPSLGKADPAPRKSAARETHSSQKTRPGKSRTAGDGASSAATPQAGP